MNPLKALFNKVFDSTPPVDLSNAPKEDAAFEWNPDEETVAPTSARTTSWKRGDTPDEGPSRVPGEATDADIAASAHNLPTPMFERKGAKGSALADSPVAPVRTLWNEPAAPPRPSTEESPFVSLKSPTPPPLSARPEPSPPSRASSDHWVKPSLPELPATSISSLPTTVSPPPVPASDFEEVYRRAGIKSPVHGYGVERVYRLLTSRRLAGLDWSVRRSALLTALDAAGVPPSDVSQDAVLRRKSLTAYEAEKALELQSLRSRNESRAEALQDTVETFTRQKQSQIERLAQGSTSAVRSQSDLEIRKRMEQDRLYRSLAYFVEPLPPPASEVRPAISGASRVIERFDAPIEMRPLTREEALLAAEMGRPSSGNEIQNAEPVVEAVTVTPSSEDVGADTRPLSQSGLEMALRAAAEEARAAGWGRTAIVDDSAGGAVDALRKLREDKKTDSES